MKTFNVAGRKTAASVFIFAILTLSLPFALVSEAQVRAIYDVGAIGLGQKLKRLQTTASAMHTAAHPDDEDSGLMAYLARHEQARTAYFSLNRGDGGQNVIGEELFEGLGVIRTEELLQARRLDGGDQFFGDVMDYGFSKTRAEAARMWDERALLGSMVRAIRMYRPMVVISRFSGTPADGHGHHQMAGYLTPLAFEAAGDPKEFPEHIQEGIEPWQPLKLYVGQGFGATSPVQPSVLINTGTYDSLIGRSYFEIAMEGRSQHKSQEMGVLELRGPMNSGLRRLEAKVDAPEKEASIFDGIDTSITGIAKLTNNNEEQLATRLAELQATAEAALKAYQIYSPDTLVPILARGHRQAREAKDSTSNTHTKALLAYKEKEFGSALQMAAGVVVDALSDVEMINAGTSTNVGVRVFAPEGAALKVVKTEISTPSGWSASSIEPPAAAPATGFRPRNETATNAAFFSVSAPADAKPTQPYWLERQRQGATFDWSTAGDSKNMPFASPLLIAKVTAEIGGESIVIERPVEYRFADDIRGEIRRDVQVVPAVTVGLGSNQLIVPAAASATKHRIVTTITNNTTGAVKGTTNLEMPAGWSVVPASANFELARPGNKGTFVFDVTIPANVRPGAYPITAAATVDRKRFTQQMQEIAYPHIQTHRVYTDSIISAKVVDLKVAPVKVGYVMGSGDRVAEAIQRMGIDVTMLRESDLSTGDLSQFDTIVVGIRASQTRPDLVANNGRLLNYVREGGTLVVQYQQHEYVNNNLQPFPASMTAVTRGNQRISNMRVTDENAEVKILVSDHPIFNYPNKIVDSDWDNWVQERNLYSFTTFDDQYTPLLSTADDGEDPNLGGMLYAPLGKGRYLYTSYSWFRQLPAGNPGAYRIFANILSMPKAGK